MNQNGTRLPSHVDQLKTPGIDMTAGSLGQGLSCACGVALAGQAETARTTASSASSATARATRARSGRPRCSPPTTSSTTWWPSPTATRCRSTAAPRKSSTLEPLADKWRAFGWEVFEIDGHDWDDIHAAMQQGDRRHRQAGHDHRPHDQGQGQPRRREPGRQPSRQGARPGQPTTSSCAAWSYTCPLPYAELELDTVLVSGVASRIELATDHAAHARGTRWPTTMTWKCASSTRRRWTN